MEVKRAAQNCRWAEPTLYLPLPYWMEAWDRPWTCRREPVARPLETTVECAACPHWKARAEVGHHWVVSQLGL